MPLFSTIQTYTTSYTRSFLIAAAASDARGTLGLGTAATFNIGPGANTVVTYDNTGNLTIAGTISASNIYWATNANGTVTGGISYSGVIIDGTGQLWSQHNLYVTSSGTLASPLTVLHTDGSAVIGNLTLATSGLITTPVGVSFAAGAFTSDSSGNVVVHGFKMNVGVTTGYGLVTDSSGNGTWQAIMTQTTADARYVQGSNATVTFTDAALGTTTTTAVRALNSTAAGVGAQQYSPAIQWTGQGWKTTSTAASQAVDFRAYVVPVQGAAAPSGLWTLESAINGGSYAFGLTYDTAGNLVIPGSLTAQTGIHTFNSLGTTTSTGVVIQNNTAAGAGAQQYSPSFNWVGQGWKTTSVAASQTVAFRAYVVPVQGTANPTGLWSLESSINGGSYANTLTYDTAGTLTATLFSGSGASLTALVATNLSTGTVPTARLGSGSASSTTALFGDQTYKSAVTSVTLTVPSWLTVGGSPITTSGTLAVTATSGQTANQFLATPNGSSGTVGLRAIVAADFGTTMTPQFARIGIGSAADPTSPVLITDNRNTGSGDIAFIIKNNVGAPALAISNGSSTGMYLQLDTGPYELSFRSFVDPNLVAIGVGGYLTAHGYITSNTGFKVGADAGATDTFSTNDGRTATVEGGIITSIA